MRTVGELLPKKRLISGERKVLDEKTVLFIATKVLEEEYGLRGKENISPIRFQEGKLFLSFRSSLWMNEVYFSRAELLQKINVLLGQEGVKEIKASERH